jgi:hypothetical protein
MDVAADAIQRRRPMIVDRNPRKVGVNIRDNAIAFEGT